MIKVINNPIILVDGSFYMYRAYHAFPAFTTSRGNPVWVIYGVMSMIRSLLRKYDPMGMIVVFDALGNTFRDDIFKLYKANRLKMPQDLYQQIEPLYDMIQAMGVTVLNIPHVEADDIIATLANFYSKLGKMVLVSTGDKDMAQIVSSKIILINTMSNIVFDSEEIKKKFGVPPILMADYLALTGDRSDNIPGVPGIGKKIAPILLNRIGNLQMLYQNLDNILNVGIRKAKIVQNALIMHKATALLSYKLASLKIDVPVENIDFIYVIRKINIKDLLFLFKKYEFNNWIEELRLGIWLHKNENSNSMSSDVVWKATCDRLNQIQGFELNYVGLKKTANIMINKIDSLNHWVSKIHEPELLILNIYADSFDMFKANVISICVSVCSVYIEENIYIPIVTPVKDFKNCCDNRYNLNFKEILLSLKPILENSKIKKIGQNMKFIYSLLRQYNIDLQGITFDITLELYILYGSANYNNIQRFLGLDTFNAITCFKKVYDSYINSYIFSKTRNIELELSCTAELMQSIFKLHQILWSKIKNDDNLKRMYENIEIPLISILSRIERYGVLIDKELLNLYADEFNYRLNALKVKVYKLIDIPFNLDSTKQLQEILYGNQKLPILKRTPNGAPSTNEEVLKKLSKKYLIPRIILKYRGLSKLKSMYTNKLISMINKNSNRVHTSYNQTRTATGRLSSANPNLQNIPSRNHDGRKIRQAFIAPSNFLIVSADYSQIELRIMAHLSRDFKLVNDFISGKDIHAATASEIFMTDLHLVTDEQRNFAKTINFGLIYGMSAFGLARQLSITYKEAQKYVDRYFQRYPGIMQYMKSIKDSASKNGYVLTLDGRKLYLPDIYSTNVSQKKSAERAAINAPMQGSAADIIKKAMVSIDFWLEKNNIPARMIMQVHDELVFEVQSNLIDIVVKQIKKLMEECFVLYVPLKVDIGIGKNWEQAH